MSTTTNTNTNSSSSSGPGCIFVLLGLVLFFMLIVASEFYVGIDNRLDRLETAAGVVSPCETNTGDVVDRMKEEYDCPEKEGE